MRLSNLIIGDIRFQWRYGFYFIYLILALLYICVLGAMPNDFKNHAAAIMIYSDPAAMGLFFMGAIVLLEKSQKVLNAIAISPVKVSEYILSKTVALMLISCVVAVVLGLAAGTSNFVPIIGGTAITSAIFTMLGIIAATRIAGLNQFLFVILPIELICFVPPIANLFVELPQGFRFFPFMACMNLITGNSQSLIFDLLLMFLTVAVLYWIAFRQVSKMWRSIGGVKL